MELPKPSFAESTILQKPELTLNQELDQMLINHKIPKLHDKVVRGEEMSWNIKVQKCNYFRNLMNCEAENENETTTPVLTSLKPNEEIQTKKLKIPNLNFTSRLKPKMKTSKFLNKLK